MLNRPEFEKRAVVGTKEEPGRPSAKQEQEERLAHSLSLFALALFRSCY